MQRAVYTDSIRNDILSLMARNGLEEGCYVEMLDYIIELFESQGLGADYYGYHNINHELEVTFIALLAAKQDRVRLGADDIKHLYVAALLHDFDPQKSVDKPHEESVLRYITTNRRLGKMIAAAGIDVEVVKALILRTTYPWAGEARKRAEAQIRRCFKSSGRAGDDPRYQKHVMDMGWYLSVADRIGGYALGDFSKAMEMAKMNAHALAWKPSWIVKNAVTYFEDLLNKDSDMVKGVLRAIPEEMRKNFFGTVLSFMRIRQKEITIQAQHSYDNLRIVPVIDCAKTRQDRGFARALYKIFLELPTPLQFGRERFEESIRSPETILTTLRLDNRNGEIVGFAKGGPLERYSLREEIRDENYGRGNTVFLEPLALKMGYWGLKGGSKMRHMFVMQALSMKYKYLTSFALRDVIKGRAEREQAEFVALFDPERWDYYRIRI